ncbi:uncharacterized protein LOC129571356, partial [Sitodiplosis mosellana]|uniref:uncharacterized protein LOC129571356 n=1 Tax=Sitodiplosis mosellana TaxID=263140 RepID=UPI0024442CBA
MDIPSELSLTEIRNFMLKNGGKVTNHELVKYFKQFLTNPNTKEEARKRFKTYVNILSTIKNENSEKYLILRKRYYNESPIEYEPDDDLNLIGNPELLQSPGSRSGISEHDLCSSGQFLNVFQNQSPECLQYKEPPPYKPPPKVLLHAYKNQEKYSECVDEFRSALYSIGCQRNNADSGTSKPEQAYPENPPKCKSTKDDVNYSKRQMLEATPAKSNISTENTESVDKENVFDSAKTSFALDAERTLDKQISVKEATKKFNRIASEEEASKIISPNAKKKPEK